MMVFLISVDRNYGGFYVEREGYGWRVCLGFVAFTLIRWNDRFFFDAVNEKLDRMVQESKEMVSDD